ncbi:MAG: PEGA domain-containing protein, partial [Deltaproteobacteria bacterium]|nr:PEGA domain-containing protein [Deltaproteobacteria bacterium]
IAAMAAAAPPSFPAAVGATAAVPSIAAAPRPRRVPVALLAVGFVVLAGGVALGLLAFVGKGDKAKAPVPVAATGPSTSGVGAAGAVAASRPATPASAPGGLAVASSQPGAQVKVELPKGTLTIVTGRANAVVTVDGKEAGRGAKVTVVGVMAGASHQVRVEAEGRQAEERSVTVAAGQTKTETFALKRAGGGRPAAAAAVGAAGTKGGTQKLVPETKTPKKPASTDETLKPW